MKIHKEGNKVIRNFLLFLLGINILVLLINTDKHIAWSVSSVSLLIMLLVIRFFRVPSRNLLMDENSILCPADGKIVAIEETSENEYFKDKRIQISIFMSIWNVHVNWHPIDGNIKYFKYHPGKYLLAKHPKSSLENERTSIVIEKTKEQAIMIRQIAGAVARRIVTYANIDKTIKQAEQLGIIKFGSRVDVFLPLDTKLNIKLKDKVKAQESVLGFWK